MANQCYHHINYYGKEENIASLRKELQTLITRCAATNEGQAPDGFDKVLLDFRYWFDLSFTDEGNTDERKTTTSTVHWCKWGEDIEVVKYLGLRHNVEFVCDYEESGSEVYGRFSYKECIFVQVNIPIQVHEDITECDDDDAGEYKYKGEHISNKYEFFDEMLDKMEQEQFEQHKAEFNIKPGS